MPQKIKQDIPIGRNIRRCRKEAGLTQQQVVDILKDKYQISISHTAYSQIETGEGNIKIAVLVALSSIFSVDFDTLFQNAVRKQVADQK